MSLFAREVIKATSSKWEEWGEGVRKFIRNAVPKISFGNQPGEEVELELSWADKKINPLEIYDLPEIIAKKKKLRVVICLDEFQNIAYFVDHVGVQKQMRSVWQKHQHASYCLYGSKKHFLTHIFTHQSMPFYKFGDLMYLPKIEISHWYPKLGWGNKARETISEMKKAWQAGGQTVAVYQANASGPAQYILVTRYKQGLKEKNAGFRKPFKESYEETNGEGSYNQYLEDASEYIKESWSELLFLQKDLSSK